MTVQYSFQFSQSWLFQLANAFLFLSYISPSILALRMFLSSAGLCFMLWGWLILPFSFDTVLWNACFMCINVVQTLRILWSMRPVAWDADRAKLYDNFFSGENGTNLLPKAEFKALTEETIFQLPVNEGGISRGQSFSRNDSVGAPPVPSSSSFVSPLSPRAAATVPTKLCQVKTYRKGDLVAVLGDRANTLSIILEGRCVVEALREHTEAAVAAADKQSWRPVAVLNELGFTDRPEWTSRRSSRRPVYSVQIRVDSPTCRIFTWDARALDAFLRTRPEHTGAVLMSVVGLDLARKVFSANIDQKELEDELYHAPQDTVTSPNGTTTMTTRATASKARLFHLLTPEVGVKAAAEVAAAITANKRTAATDSVNGSHVIGMNGVNSSHAASPASNAADRSSSHAVMSIELATIAPSQAISPEPSASPESPVVGDALYPAASPAEQNRALASLLYYTRVTCPRVRSIRSSRLSRSSPALSRSLSLSLSCRRSNDHSAILASSSARTGIRLVRRSPARADSDSSTGWAADR